MEHEDAVREMAVERYLLGELAGDDRNRFEDHLFTCRLCTEDLTGGSLFVRGATAELARQSSPLATPKRARDPFEWLGSLLRPAFLVPALAASVVLLLGETFIAIPHLRQEVASAETPGFVEDLALAGGAARGETGSKKVVAPPHGSFLLSVDIPADPRFTGYRCSLLSPSGVVVWQGELTPEQVRDAVHIRVPSAITAPGTNVLLVEGRLSIPGGSAFTEIARHPFDLVMQDAPAR